MFRWSKELEAHKWICDNIFETVEEIRVYSGVFLDVTCVGEIDPFTSKNTCCSVGISDYTEFGRRKIIFGENGLSVRGEWFRAGIVDNGLSVCRAGIVDNGLSVRMAGIVENGLSVLMAGMVENGLSARGAGIIENGLSVRMAGIVEKGIRSNKLARLDLNSINSVCMR
ncbi:hypothetical protein CDAR_199711 [Caerostris darwini]|uniref:Uncharacterized protein n=1 Tax=Caerostris darwini TaxID=1538125 RepID=A0AAV4V794_9ARAC|nr:hypothetical protein CDAR_199711 [Caerostris darwini]